MKREEVDVLQEIGALESKLDIDEAKRKTIWFGDYALYEKRDLQEQIDYSNYMAELNGIQRQRQSRKRGGQSR